MNTRKIPSYVSHPTQIPQTHTPVLLRELLTGLRLVKGGIYVDATFGCGGWTRMLLEHEELDVLAIDRDPEAMERARELQHFYPDHLRIHQGKFGDLEEILLKEGIKKIDGLLLDLGVSSPQLDTAERGFSFRFDGPLDMRMERRGLSACEVVNRFSDVALMQIIEAYGEEFQARRIASAIVKSRVHKPITRTLDLASIIRQVVRKKSRIDPVTRTFQALRIYINNEIQELQKSLEAAERVLKPGGQLVVVSFHSLEDRVIKDFLQSRTGKILHACRHHPEQLLSRLPMPSFRLLTKKPLRPTFEELSCNPRAHSARMRLLERTEVEVLGLKNYHNNHL